jgi:hypothetical protein
MGLFVLDLLANGPFAQDLLAKIGAMTQNVETSGLEALAELSIQNKIGSGTDVMIYKIFSPKNRRKNWRF